MGKIFIASMNLRAGRARPPAGVAFRILNVTSAQYNNSEERRDFSPMTQSGYTSPFSGEIYNNFESFWQSGKVYEGLEPEITRGFWLKNRKPLRRWGRTAKKRVLYSCWKGMDENKKMDYITSRKEVYVPLYHNMIAKTAMASHWKRFVEDNPDKNVLIYDFDGPRAVSEDKTAQLACLEVTEEVLKEKINDERFPFGHGYVVAAHLAGIPIEKFT